MKKTLKFLSWMFVAVLSVLSFSSCSDDDDKDSPKDFNGISMREQFGNMKIFMSLVL